MMLCRGFVILALTLACVCPERASAQSASAEVVVTTPPAYGAPGVVPPPPSASGPAASGPAATGAVFVPAGSTPTGSPNAVYVPPTAGVYTPAAVPRERRVIDWGLVGGGIGLFAGGWLVTFVSTIAWYAQTTSCSGGLWSGTYSCTHIGGPGGEGLLFSFIPVVGPWLMLSDPYLDTPGEIAFPVIAGLVQDAGLILLIVGLATMHTETTMAEARRAGDVRLNGGASPGGVFGSLDVVF